MIKKIDRFLTTGPEWCYCVDFRSQKNGCYPKRGEKCYKQNRKCPTDTGYVYRGPVWHSSQRVKKEQK